MSPGPGRPGQGAVLCPHCSLPVDEGRARDYAGIARLGCLSCGVQLVRRPGGAWESIRG